MHKIIRRYLKMKVMRKVAYEGKGTLGRNFRMKGLYEVRCSSQAHRNSVGLIVISFLPLENTSRAVGMSAGGELAPLSSPEEKEGEERSLIPVMGVRL